MQPKRLVGRGRAAASGRGGPQLGAAPAIIWHLARLLGATQAEPWRALAFANFATRPPPEQAPLLDPFGKACFAAVCTDLGILLPCHPDGAQLTAPALLS